MARSARSRKGPRTARPSRKGDRTCIACRGRAPRDELIRLVRAPSGEVLVDRYLRAPGRGAHLHYDLKCIHEAARRQAYGRAFVAPISPVDPGALAAAVLAGLDARITDGLALARRAGATLTGADGLANGWTHVRLLVLAEDIASGTAERLVRRATATSCPVAHFGQAEWLGALIGRGARVAVGVTDAGLASRLTVEFARRDRVLVAAQG